VSYGIEWNNSSEVVQSSSTKTILVLCDDQQEECFLLIYVVFLPWQTQEYIAMVYNKFNWVIAVDLKLSPPSPLSSLLQNEHGFESCGGDNCLGAEVTPPAL
jgi:hypothetical protein